MALTSISRTRRRLTVFMCHARMIKHRFVSCASGYVTTDSTPGSPTNRSCASLLRTAAYS